MVDTNGSNIVFLLCVPRSGSSLTTFMLQNHSRIFATQEMWFLMSLHDLRIQQSRPYGGASILTRFFNGMLTDEMFVRASRAFALQVYHDLLQTCGGQYIVDKSPRYYYLLEFLDQLFPHSRRIMLVRNPLDIAASYKKVHAGSKDPFRIEKQLYQQELDMKTADLTVGLFRYAAYMAEDNPYACRVSYEQLVTNPKEELVKLCDFLGISYEDGMERYGDHLHSSKSDLFFSMGVGDPELAKHRAPHPGSIGGWQQVLNKREVELVCRAIGAAYFHKNGYADQLEAAERLTGSTFDQEPDADLLARRTKQIERSTGCKWTPNYRMVTEATPGMGVNTIHSAQGAGEENQQSSKAPSSEQRIVQLEVTLRAAEHRLQQAYEERDRYIDRYAQLKKKIDRMKSRIPFSRSIARWADAYFSEGGKRP